MLSIHKQHRIQAARTTKIICVFHKERERERHNINDNILNQKNMPGKTGSGTKKLALKSLCAACAHVSTAPQPRSLCFLAGGKTAEQCIKQCRSSEKSKEEEKPFAWISQHFLAPSVSPPKKKTKNNQTKPTPRLRTIPRAAAPAAPPT